MPLKTSTITITITPYYFLRCKSYIFLRLQNNFLQKLSPEIVARNSLPTQFHGSSFSFFFVYLLLTKLQQPILSYGKNILPLYLKAMASYAVSAISQISSTPLFFNLCTPKTPSYSEIFLNTLICPLKNLLFFTANPVTRAKLRS